MNDQAAAEQAVSLTNRGAAKSVALASAGAIDFEILGAEAIGEFAAFLFTVYRDAYAHIGVHMQQEQQRIFADDIGKYFPRTKIYIARVSKRRIIASYGNIIKIADEMLPIEKLFSLSIRDYAASCALAPNLIHQTWRVGGDGTFFRELGFSTADKKALFHHLHALNLADFGQYDENLVCGYSYNPAYKLDRQLGFPWRIIGETVSSRLGVPSFPMAFTIREWKERNPDFRVPGIRTDSGTRPHWL